MHTKLLPIVAISVLIGPPVVGQGTTSPPVAISIAEDGRAVVLQADGAVVDVDLVGSKRLDVLYRLPRGYTGFDVAARKRGAVPRVCVSAYVERNDTLTSWLVQPIDSGRQVWSWLPARGFYGGCAIDEAAMIAYVGSARSGEIYRVPLGQNKVEFVASVGPIRNLDLGPIAFNKATGRLVIADVESGRLYLINRRAPGAVEFARIVKGEVRALAFDPSGNLLYAADSDTETIWVIDSRSRVARPRRFSEIEEFREPVGVAVDPNGRVWVADRRLRRILRLSPDGASADVSIDW